VNSRLERLIEAMGGMTDGPIEPREQALLVEDLLSRRHRGRVGADIPAGVDDENTSHGAMPPAERAFYCVNCLREWAEPYCDECGRNLMEVKT